MVEGPFYDDGKGRQIWHGDTREVLLQLPRKIVDTIVTSPPYYKQRKYPKGADVDWSIGDSYQYGQEPTDQLYIDHTLYFFKLFKNVLKDTGSIFWNIGDSRGKNNQPLLIPQRLAIALQAEGWYLVNYIIWGKDNPLSESVTRRFTDTYEVILWVAKNKNYWFDQCLSGETEVYIRDKYGQQRPIDLVDLSQIWQEVEILTPYGWKQILAFAKTTSDKNFKVKAGHMTEMITSGNHQFPFSQRHRSIHLMKVGDVDGSHPYLLYMPIAKFLNTTVAILDLRELGLRDVEGKAIAKRLRKYNIPTNLVLDFDLGYFIGVYLAEGNLCNSWRVSFSLRNGEGLIDWLKKFLRKFSVHLCVSSIKGRNGVTACCSNPVLVELLRYFTIGHNCYNKGLNREILLNTPAGFRRGILNGYMDGDGHLNRNRALNSTSCSQQLRDDICLLASSLGYEFSKGKLLPSTDGYIKGKGVQYTSSVFTNGKYKGRGRRPFTLDKVGYSANQFDAQYITPFDAYFVGHKILEHNQSLELYDLEVEGGLFLINGGIITHNSSIRQPFAAATVTRVEYPTAMNPGSKSYEQIASGSGGHPPQGENLRRILLSGGANCWDLWCFSTASGVRSKVSKEHYASYPEELPRRCILSTTPPYTCPKCSKGWVRVTEKKYIDGAKSHDNKMIDALAWLGPVGKTSIFRTGKQAVSNTLKWEPQCDCGFSESESVPGTVLDPFVGTGTSIMVAKLMRRHGIGIDAVIDYCRASMSRVMGVTEPSFAVTREWEPEPEKPPPGIQINLFDNGSDGESEGLPNVDTCPECGKEVAHEEGCSLCRNCGLSGC